jgi:hypothetical protein
VAKRPIKGGPYRDGDKLVIPQGADMPPCCPICNSPVVEEPITLRFEAQRPEGGLTGAIAAGIERLGGWRYTGPVSVDVPFCKWHRNQKFRQIIIGAALFAAAVLYLVITFWGVNIKEVAHQGPGVGTIIGFILVLTGLIYGLSAWQESSTSWFKTEGFVDRAVWVTGACKSYLKSLPKYERDEA